MHLKSESQSESAFLGDQNNVTWQLPMMDCVQNCPDSSCQPVTQWTSNLSSTKRALLHPLGFFCVPYLCFFLLFFFQAAWTNYLFLTNHGSCSTCQKSFLFMSKSLSQDINLIFLIILQILVGFVWFPSVMYACTTALDSFVRLS